MQGFRDLVHGWFGKAVLAVVIALFALYGTDALISLASKPAPVARVQDAELFRDQLTGMVEQQKQAILRQNPGLPLDFLKDDFLRSQVAQRWVERQLIDQALAEWGVRPDQKAVVSQLQADSRFSIDGQIQQDQLESFLKANGLSPQVLFDEIRSNLGLDKLLTSLEASEFITPKQAEQVYNLQEQTREFQLARISPEAVKSEIDLTEDQLNAYYQNNISQYMKPETAQVQYVVIDQEKVTADLNLEPSDADLQGYYETYKQNMQQEEKRQSAHILIDASQRSEDEALELAESIYQKIQSGEDFAALAKEYSDDLPSAEDGGRLPIAERGTFVEPFEEALYSLSEGEVSEPVKTEFGYHIIRLAKTEAVEPESFEAKREELVQNYIERQKLESFRSFIDDVEVVAFESPNLEALAEQYDLEIKTTEPFSRRAAPAPLNTPKVLDAVFAEDFFEAARNSDIIEVDDQVILLHPVEYKASAPESFAQVKEQVKKAAEEEAAIELAAQKGRDIIAKLKSGQTLSESEKTLLGDWTSYDGVDRRSSEVSGVVLQKLFAMPKPSEKARYAGIADQTDFVIIQFNKVNQHDSDAEIAEASPEAALLAENNESLETLSQQLKNSASQGLTALLVDALKDGADIEYNMDFVLDQNNI